MLPLATFAAQAAAGIGRAAMGGMEGGAARARRTATEFETMFLEQSLDRIAQSEGTDGPLGENGNGGGVWRSMLTKAYAGELVRSGGVGIADQVYREMLKLQEVGRGAA